MHVVLGSTNNKYIKKAKKKRKVEKEAEISSWGLALFPRDPPAGNTASSIFADGVPADPFLDYGIELCAANSHTKNTRLQQAFKESKGEKLVAEKMHVACQSQVCTQICHADENTTLQARLNCRDFGDGEESFLEFATGEELGNPRRYPNWPIPSCHYYLQKRCQTQWKRTPQAPNQRGLCQEHIALLGFYDAMPCGKRNGRPSDESQGGQPYPTAHEDKIETWIPRAQRTFYTWAGEEKCHGAWLWLRIIQPWPRSR
ncbi:uncharacterized protein ARB_05783 [Trichophyton benhamiae CBS 112371]|uniref:Uncharacterized protein n=1 Tax=Arthroderma benhamiae (strain ATCC MYA-4681 / CBS 112371) TaxID=663331 RepID=D4ANH8_ARTBC|nr:uncharacterized protein ARB_05783 [Trichophyton benhamiae CBS 112371]EFE35739.1 hypothetical protein ARB_05783 [Trichophyton benhamiae CBS 112371]